MPNSISNAPAPLDLANLLTGQGVSPTELAAPDFRTTGLPGGFTIGCRWVGATAGGPPGAGSFLAGDFTISLAGKLQICIASGTPGTWVEIGPPTAGEVAASDFKATGLTGSVAASRYVGATTTGAPTTGAHLAGDFSIDQTGKIWVCTVAGTPGTFVNIGAGAGPTIQRGIVSYPANTASLAVALPVAFVDADYSVVASSEENTNGVDMGLIVQAQRNTASSFNIQVNIQPNHTSAWAPPTSGLAVEWIAVHA